MEYDETSKHFAAKLLGRQPKRVSHDQSMIFLSMNGNDDFANLIAGLNQWGVEALKKREELDS